MIQGFDPLSMRRLTMRVEEQDEQEEAGNNIIKTEYAGTASSSSGQCRVP